MADFMHVGPCTCIERNRSNYLAGGVAAAAAAATAFAAVAAPVAAITRELCFTCKLWRGLRFKREGRMEPRMAGELATH